MTAKDQNPDNKPRNSASSLLNKFELRQQDRGLEVVLLVKVRQGVKNFLYVLLFLMCLPIFGAIVAFFTTEEGGGGAILVMIFLGSIFLYVLRLALWQFYGTETLLIEPDKITVSHSYKYWESKLEPWEFKDLWMEFVVDSPEEEAGNLYFYRKEGEEPLQTTVMLEAMQGVEIRFAIEAFLNSHKAA